MLEIFDLIDNKVIVTMEVLIHPVLGKLYSRDTSEKKYKSQIEYTYLNYMVSYKKSNPFVGFADLDERRRKIVESITREFERETVEKIILHLKEDLLVTTCLEILTELWDSCIPALSSYKTALISRNTLSSFLDTMNLNAKTNSGGAMYKPTDLTSAVKELKNLNIVIADLKKDVEADVIEQLNTRRGRMINFFETTQSIDVVNKK